MVLITTLLLFTNFFYCEEVAEIFMRSRTNAKE